MLPLFSNLIRNKQFQDFTGVCRGLIRVIDGNRQKSNLFPDRPEQISTINNKQSDQSPPVLTTEPQSQIIVKDKEKEKLSASENLNASQNLHASENITLRVNKIPESSFSRAFQFSQLGLNLTSNALKKVIGSRFSENKISFKQALVSEENASILAQGLCKMRGAPLKLAQALSIQEDEVIPKHIRQAFEQARQNADVMPQSQLEKMLVQELGKDWMNNFSEFNIKPFAAASIGQVHLAKTINGLEVAIKIQYSGVRESIDSDLNNLKRIMDLTKMFPKTMFLDKLIENTRKELREECDYVLEANKQMNYLKLFQDQKEYIVPQVVDHLSTSRILTAEYLKGDSLDYVADNYPQHLRNEIGRRIMSLTLQEIFKFNTMQTDPNPSNFYFNRKTDKLILIDFGAVHQYSKIFIDNYIAILYGAVTNNRQICLNKSVEIGFLTGEESIRMKEAHVDSIITVAEPFKSETLFDFGEQQMTKKIYELMPVMLKYRLRPPPQEIYSLHRKLSGAYLMNIRLKTKINCRDIFMNLYEFYKNQQK